MVVAIALLASACGAGPSASGRAPDPAAAGPAVILPDGFEVAVEVASDPDTRARGLMYRPQLAAGRGMLFLFPQTGHYSFWMKDTLIPLDIIWMGEEGRVVDVQEDVPPCRSDPCPSYEPAGEARYVLELGAGQARQHGVRPGSTIRMRDIEQYIVR